MLGIQLEGYLAFLAATLVIAVVPGPDHVYLGAVALRDGRRAGVVAASGMAASMTIHTLVAVTGIGAVVTALPAALVVIRLLGGCYLVLLGINALRSPAGPETPPTASAGRNFWRAVVVNLTNPKIVIFFIAFLPQFVDTATGHAAGQLFLLGLSFVVVGFLIDAAYALLGGFIGRILTGRGRNARVPALISGCLYLGLGALVLASALADLLPADVVSP